MSPILTIAASRLSTLDWIVVGGYLVIMLASGVWFARREPSGASEYFLANRRMPAWAVSFSVIASTLSVATFIGVPESVYKGDMRFLSTTIGSFLAVAVVAAFFIPAFYKANVTTVYELLERRFGPTTKQAASASFMIGRLFASGARIYIAAIPLSMVLFGPQYFDSPSHLIRAIALLSVVAVLYTLIGGIASVIWTDVIQTIVLIGASLGAVLVLLHKIPLPLEGIWDVLSAPQPDGTTKTTVLELGLTLTSATGRASSSPDTSSSLLGFNPGQNYTLLTALFGFSLINMAAYGTDHDLAQRMLTCKSAIKGSRSAWTAILINLPITLIFMAIGALLYVYYKPETWQNWIGGTQPQLEPNLQVFPTFILNEMPQGLAGLMLAGLFAAGLGSLNSAINAMAATFVSDFYMPAVKGRSEKHYLLISRAATIGWGLLLAAFAVACIYWKRSSPQTTLIDFALQVMTFAYAGLLAVFLTAIFTKRGNTISALAALATGFGVILAFQAAPSLLAWLDTPVRASGGTTPATAWPKIAYPWQMLIATTLSFAVCCLGAPKSPSQVTVSQ